MRYLLLMILGLWSLVCEAGTDVKTYIPPKAIVYMPMIMDELNKVIAGFPEPAYFPALMEHESCISLTHSRCFSPTSRLLTSREEGAGIGQITRTFNPNGTVRFDALTDLRRSNPNDLKDLSWKNVYERPDLQFRAVMLMQRTNWKAFYRVPTTFDRLAMMDAAYNRGLGGINKERTVCGLKKGCDPNKWFGHVEKTCLASKKPLYGQRSACDINRHHVDDVLNTRMPKYQRYLATKK